MSRPIEHSEYIRRKYLSGGDDEKKSRSKNKKLTSKFSNVKIFDDDINLADVKVDEDDEFYYSVKEEQPLVVPIAEFSNKNWVIKEEVKEKKVKEEKVKPKEEKVKSIYRDKKTGQVRNLDKEAKEKEEKDYERAKEKKKFDELSAGLKQTKEAKEKLEADLYEMSKPFARYEDDEDRDKILREKEIQGDPMLDYIRKRKAKKEQELALKLGKEYKPKLEYKGPAPSPLNRFNIAPGHRWDGVDRSNGFEKRFLERKTEKMVNSVLEDI